MRMIDEIAASFTRGSFLAKRDRGHLCVNIKVLTKRGKAISDLASFFHLSLFTFHFIPYIHLGVAFTGP